MGKKSGSGERTAPAPVIRVEKQKDFVCCVCKNTVSKRKSVHVDPERFGIKIADEGVLKDSSRSFGLRACREHIGACGQCGKPVLTSELVETKHPNGETMFLCKDHLRLCFVAKRWVHMYFTTYMRLENHGFQHIQMKYIRRENRNDSNDQRPTARTLYTAPSTEQKEAM